MGERRKKPYIMSNIDGHNSALVMATTLAEAAALMQTSVYYMRQMGWHAGDDADAEAAAKGGVMYRPTTTQGEYPWSPTRYKLTYIDRIPKWEPRHALPLPDREGT